MFNRFLIRHVRRIEDRTRRVLEPPAHVHVDREIRGCGTDRDGCRKVDRHLRVGIGRKCERVGRAARVGEHPDDIDTVELGPQPQVRARRDQGVKDHLGCPVERQVDLDRVNANGRALVLVVVVGVGLVGVGRRLAGVGRRLVAVGMFAFVVVSGARRVARQLDVRQRHLRRRNAHRAAGALDNEVCNDAGRGGSRRRADRRRQVDVLERSWGS